MMFHKHMGIYMGGLILGGIHHYMVSASFSCSLTGPKELNSDHYIQVSLHMVV